jgi:hypothetical protein
VGEEASQLGSGHAAEDADVGAAAGAETDLDLPFGPAIIHTGLGESVVRTTTPHYLRPDE